MKSYQQKDEAAGRLPPTVLKQTEENAGAQHTFFFIIPS